MVSGKANSSSRGRSWAAVDDLRAGSNPGGKTPASSRSRKAAKVSRPLDQTALNDLALAYVARFATSAAKLETYLARKLRERGQGMDDHEFAHDEDSYGAAIDIPAIVSRMIALGYVDDDAYARMRSRDLARRGFGAKRIEQALWAAGVSEGTRADHAPDEAERRRAAARLAQKRRFGPFGSPVCDPGVGHDPGERAAIREKAIAAMLRAGHELDHARFILAATDPAQVEHWVAEAEDAYPSERGGK